MGLCYNPFVRDLFERSIRPVSEEGCSRARSRATPPGRGAVIFDVIPSANTL